jgi:hypothetical protein
MPFRDGQSIGWERYPACDPDPVMEWLTVRDAAVHEALDRLLRGAADALPADRFVTLYERIATHPNTGLMLDVLQACGIAIAF